MATRTRCSSSRVGSTLVTDSASHVLLSNGAQACNVFWQVGSSATLGTSSIFQGSILALTSITVTTGDTIEGRALARNGAVTLDDDTITVPTCAAPTPTPTPTSTSTSSPAPTPTRPARHRSRRPPAPPGTVPVADADPDADGDHADPDPDGDHADTDAHQFPAGPADKFPAARRRRPVLGRAPSPTSPTPAPSPTPIGTTLPVTG